MGLINVVIVGLEEDFIWFIQKEYKMKKTLKSGKKTVKTQPEQMLEQADKAAMEMSLRQAGIKKTMLKKKKAVKKIWVSKDKDHWESIGLWNKKPKLCKSHHGKDFRGYPTDVFFDTIFENDWLLNALFSIKPGQCKCFEIKEVDA